MLQQLLLSGYVHVICMQLLGYMYTLDTNAYSMLYCLQYFKRKCCQGGTVFVFVYCRMMYWSVIGDHSHIEESAMDGSLRRVLLEKNLRRPTGISFKAH